MKNKRFVISPGVSKSIFAFNSNFIHTQDLKFIGDTIKTTSSTKFRSTFGLSTILNFPGKRPSSSDVGPMI